MARPDEPAGSTDRPPSRGRTWRRRILWGIFTLVVVVALVGVLTTRWAVRRPFPQIEGTMVVPGLTGEVEVVRDSFGIPHIYADSLEDLFMAQGLVHAQDRFFQMDFWRHISSGTLSEMFGSSQLDTDRFLRTVGWHALAQRQYDDESQAVTASLDAYAAGVNSYVEPRAPGALGFEYAIIGLLNRGYVPAPWSGTDSLAWGKVMAWELGGNLETEIERALLLGRMPAERVAQLFPPYPGDRHPYIVEEQTGAATAAEASLAIPEDAFGALTRAGAAVRAIDDVTGGGMGTGIGSNSWAVSGDHTPTGSPMLMNDTHLASQMPSIWYLMGLHCRTVDEGCPMDVVGYSFPGVPGIIIGHNANIAWGFTNTGPDVQDLYVEKINPDDPDQYEYRGEWVDMDVHTETISVAGGDDVELVVRSTIHGPIISDVYEPLDDFETSGIETPDPYAIALRWTALDDAPSIASTILAFDTATDIDSFRAAAATFAVPAQNLLYADVEGNIGYQMPGRIPIRASGDGTVPVPGWTGANEWTGYVPFEELPNVLNPASGWIVTANNAVIDEGYPHLITEDWSYGYRARRILDLVSQNPSRTLEGWMEVQFDSRDLNAEYLRPFVLTAVGDDELDDTATDALAALAEWDLQSPAESTGAAVWNATWREILARTFHDEYLEDWYPQGGDRWFEVVRHLAASPDDPFWDDLSTDAVEDRDDILLASFIGGVDELTDRLGARVADWWWGDIHTITFENQSLGTSGIGLIEDRFNRGPYPAPGTKSTPNAVGWDADVGYEVDWIPAMRMLIDLGDLTTSYAMHSTGQSGHTDHPHYDDMIPLWLEGRNIPMWWDREDVDADAEGTLVLTP